MDLLRTLGGGRCLEKFCHISALTRKLENELFCLVGARIWGGVLTNTVPYHTFIPYSKLSPKDWARVFVYPLGPPQAPLQKSYTLNSRRMRRPEMVWVTPPSIGLGLGSEYSEKKDSPLGGGGLYCISIGF